jgi:hypothetical protein
LSGQRRSGVITKRKSQQGRSIQWNQEQEQLDERLELILLSRFVVFKRECLWKEEITHLLGLHSSLRRISFRLSEIAYSRHDNSQTKVPDSQYDVDKSDILSNVFEYKPEISASQTHLDITSKFRFDKLESPTIKRRRLSPASFDHLELVDEQSEAPNEPVSTENAGEVKYGLAWFQRSFITWC